MATILVEVLGNAKQFKAELDSAVASTEKANSGFSKMGKVAGVAGLAIAGGIAVGLTKSVEAAVAAQQATARLNAAFAASHVSAKQYAGAIDEAEAKGRKLGFTNEDVRTSLGSLIIATHNGHKAIADLAVAQDVARFKGVSLAAGTKLLTSTLAGNSRAAKQLGIVLQPVTTAQDAMKESGNKLKETILQQQKVVTNLTAAHDKSAAGVKALKDAQATLSVEQERAKQVTLSHTSAVYLNELAHAKLVDKLATANSALDLVTQKLHGQADAYANTAAGGMAQFHAQLDNLEEQVGAKLLPALTLITKWLVEALPVATADAGKAIAFLTPYFLQVKTAVETVVAVVRDHWTQISAIIKSVVDEVKAQLNLFGDLIHGRWSQIWADIVAVVKNEADVIINEAKLIGPLLLAGLEAVGKLAVQGLERGLQALPGALSKGLNALPGLALTAATLIGEAIVKGVKWAVPHIEGLAGDLTAKITSAISQVAGWVVTEAEKIGVAIAKGIVSGVGDLATSLGSKLKSEVGGALGTVKGWAGIASPSKLFANEVGKPLGDGVIDGWLTSSAALPSKMVQSLQAAITAGRSVIQAAQASFQTAWSQIASDADAAFSKLKGAVQTPAEKALSSLQGSHDTAGRTQALNDAQSALDTANAGGDPAAILSAQQQLADAKYAIQVAALQKQADAQRIQADARNALEQRNFDKALAALQTHLAKGHDTYAQAHEAILKLFKSFGVNYSNAGAELGTAFVTGLKESIQGAASKAGALSGKLSEVAGGIKIPHAATGGFVAQTGLAVIHQGETITPAGQGGGGDTYIFNGQVWDPDALVDMITNAQIRRGRRSTGGVLGGFA